MEGRGWDVALGVGRPPPLAPSIGSSSYSLPHYTGWACAACGTTAGNFHTGREALAHGLFHQTTSVCSRTSSGGLPTLTLEVYSSGPAPAVGWSMDVLEDDWFPRSDLPQCFDPSCLVWVGTEAQGTWDLRPLSSVRPGMLLWSSRHPDMPCRPAPVVLVWRGRNSCHQPLMCSWGGS